MNSKPVKSKIIESDTTTGKSWDIPAKKGVGFLMIFGCFFGGLPLLMLAFSVYASLSGTSEGPASSGWGILGVFAFLSIFIMVGAITFYFGFKWRYTSYRVSVNDGAVNDGQKSLLLNCSQSASVPLCIFSSF